MDSVLRALFVYALLLLLFRISGKRTLGSFTSFDLVLTMIISEAVQQAMIDDDNSITNATVLVLTLVGANIVVSYAKRAWPSVERVLDGTPLLLVEDGTVHKDRMKKERVDESEILEQARAVHGIERLEQIKHAVLEPDGELTIVPRPA
jgi:uncharacterized membrane protein YcaP (DUF421 family)